MQDWDASHKLPAPLRIPQIRYNVLHVRIVWIIRGIVASGCRCVHLALLLLVLKHGDLLGVPGHHLLRIVHLRGLGGLLRLLETANALRSLGGHGRGALHVAASQILLSVRTNHLPHCRRGILHLQNMRIQVLHGLALESFNGG